MYYKVTNGSVTIDAKTILEEINIEIKEKDKIAIIGRNGAGKTTLLKALISNDMLSEGVAEEKFSIFKSGINSIGYLRQENLNISNTLLDEILLVYKPLIEIEIKLKKLEEEMELGSNSEASYKYTELLDKYKILGGYQYKKEYTTALIKFGFSEEDKTKLLSSFSGGERTKIALLKLLLSKPDLLFLDEPTNHLDIDAIEWLEDYLKNYKGALILVSHDRMFIDKVTNKIYEIEYGRLESYIGNYSFYEKEKKRRYEKALNDYEAQQMEIKRLQRIADRFRYKPSKASMAMSKLKQIERMVKLDKPEKANLKTFNWRNKEFSESGKLVLKVDNLEIGYLNILNKVSFELFRGDRLGIIGKNGVGKSTLLKTLMGMIPSLAGKYELGLKVMVGYFDQQLETLNPHNSIYEEFSETFKDATDLQIRSFLANFMFYQDDVDKKISVLSGGEKVRLELAKVIFENPNFLILDEPTNHLDILSKMKLEELLINYKGTVLFVSHDRYFVSKIAKSLLVFGDRETNYFNLNYEEYLELKKANQEDEVILVSEKPKIVKTLNKEQNKNIKRLEKDINNKENKIKELKESLFEPDVYSDYKKVNDINNTILELESELVKLMEEWEKLATL
ncbi:MAG: ABC-F family ATP-binding cassette domain-containing protein [Bacilli bacterium]|nr:ABC-F family ATP-binding cassette domain-containing protein [Bacilli bacterium]